MGLLLCQMCRALGARVFGTVSTEAKAQAARAAGADHVIRYTEQDFAEAIREELGDQKLAVAYDSVGETTWRKSLGLLQPRGMLVLFGQSSGPVPPIDPLLLSQNGSLFITRPTLGDYAATPDELKWRAGEVLDSVASGKLRLTIDRELPLAQAAEAPPPPRGPRHHRQTDPPPVGDARAAGVHTGTADRYVTKKARGPLGPPVGPPASGRHRAGARNQR